MRPGPKPRPLLDRLLEKVEVCEAGYGTPCWIFRGSINRGGYGSIYLSSARGQVLAHRLAYELYVGPIPGDRELDHLCRQRACINPTHLELVTRRVHVDRRERLSHCPRGHPYDAANTLWVGAGGRRCRECNRLWCQNRRKRRAER